ncbi:MAG TPA: hypothetical protein VHN38_08145, partial [Immundisolibacter sp.]|nr:hypothetical protein [Immundisolibacter sp.]
MVSRAGCSHHASAPASAIAAASPQRNPNIASPGKKGDSVRERPARRSPWTAVDAMVAMIVPEILLPANSGDPSPGSRLDAA